MDWYWVIAGLLVVIGFVGLVMPILPGIVFIFGGLLLGAWTDDFTLVSKTTMVIIGVISLFAAGVDFIASYFTVKQAQASRLALVGTIVGAVVGLFFGVIGLIVGPIIGAAVGEYMARRNSTDATRVGIAAGLGFVLAIVAKMVFAIIVIAIFAYAYYV